MTKDFVDAAHDVSAGVGLLLRAAPDTMKAFGVLSTAATTTKTIDTKTKALWRSRLASLCTATAVSHIIPKWRISTVLAAKRSPRRSL